MEKTLLCLIVLASILFSFVACDDSPASIVTYSIDAPSYVILEEGKATIEATIKGSDGTSTEKNYDVTAEDAGYYEIKENGVSATVFVGDVLIDSADKLGAFVSENSEFKNGVLKGSIKIEGGQYKNSDSNLFGAAEASLNVSKDPVSGQGILMVDGKNIVFDNFSVNYVGEQKKDDTTLTTVEHIIKVTSIMDDLNKRPSNIVLKNLTLNLENKKGDEVYRCAGLNIHGANNVTCENITIKGESTKVAMSVASVDNLIIDNPSFDIEAWGYIGFMWADNNTFYTDSTVTLKNTENLPSFYVECDSDKTSHYTITGKDEYKETKLGTKIIYSRPAK